MLLALRAAMRPVARSARIGPTAPPPPAETRVRVTSPGSPAARQASVKAFFEVVIQPPVVTTTGTMQIRSPSGDAVTTVPTLPKAAPALVRASGLLLGLRVAFAPPPAPRLVSLPPFQPPVADAAQPVVVELHVTGTMVATLGDVAHAAAGVEVFKGTASSTLVDIGAFGGLVAFTAKEVFKSTSDADALGAFAQSATGKEVFKGTAASTLGTFTQSATGIEGFGLGASGSAAFALAAFTQSATAKEVFKGTAASTLAAFAQAATAKQAFKGTAASTLASLIQAVTAKEVFKGTASSTLGILVQATTGKEVFKATAASTLGNIAQNATGKEVFKATAASTLASVTQAGAALEVFKATAASTLGDIAAAAAGKEVFKGTVADTLGSVAQAFTGAQDVFGSAAWTVGAFTQSAVGMFVSALAPTGEMHAQLGAFTARGVGRVRFHPPAVGKIQVLNVAARAVATLPHASTIAFAHAPTLTVSRSDTMTQTIANTFTEKDPLAIWPVGFDFTAVLRGKSVASVAWEARNATTDALYPALLLGPTTVLGSVHAHLVQGGVAGVTYRLQCAILCTTGERFIAVGYLPVARA